METHPTLEVKQSYPDLIIYAGEVTLGEEDRKKMNKKKKRLGKTRIAEAACALLNSGGGVIAMQIANKSEPPVEMGLDLEPSLRKLIHPLHSKDFFEYNQLEDQFYIFVKSWNCSPGNGSSEHRICSLASSLYCRSFTSKVAMDSSAAFKFLQDKKASVKCSPNHDTPPPHKIAKATCQNSLQSNPAFEIFQSRKLERGQRLPFNESPSVEFKKFSTKSAQKNIKNIIPEYVSAFANAKGGYLFIGVDDETKRVLGCPKDNIDPDSFRRVADEAIAKLPVFHFCSSKDKVSYETRVIDVFQEGNLHGYLCVIKVEQFCCAVFSEAPVSWMVDKEKGVYSLNTEEWVRMMVDVGPGKKSLFITPTEVGLFYNFVLLVSRHCFSIYPWMS